MRRASPLSLERGPCQWMAHMRDATPGEKKYHISIQVSAPIYRNLQMATYSRVLDESSIYDILVREVLNPLLHTLA